MFFQQLSLCCLHKHNTQLLTMNIPHAGLRAFSYCAKKYPTVLFFHRFHHAGYNAYSGKLKGFEGSDDKPCLHCGGGCCDPVEKRIARS